MYKQYFKSTIDFLVSLIALVILAPVFVLATVLLFFVNHGKPFFIQSRPGKNAKVFNVIKFKTMNDKLDSKGCLLPDAERLTPVGSFVRKTSLDELPQLINVLKGDMSLIGPRPLLEEYLPLYNKTQKRRHEVRPGITGWAQINGRNAISWKKKFEYDVSYVDNVSLSLDVKILLKTAYNVFKQDGIYKDGVIASMEAFNGKN